MPAYDGRNFNPPAPLALVTLRNPNGGNSVPNVPMLIDSGADATLVPEEFVAAIGAAVDPQKSYELMSFDGAKSVARVASLEIVFLNRVFKGQFLIGNQEWGVLGRNVLNHLAVFLDGPRLVWDEIKPPIKSASS